MRTRVKRGHYTHLPIFFIAVHGRQRKRKKKKKKWKWKWKRKKTKRRRRRRKKLSGREVKRDRGGFALCSQHFASGQEGEVRCATGLTTVRQWLKGWQKG